jgi:glycosyltransferase involved in cell wall biosynthesis
MRVINHRISTQFLGGARNLNSVHPVNLETINGSTAWYRSRERILKILLVANYIPDAQQSMLRYAELLQQGLTKAGHEVRVIRPEERAGKFASGPSGAKWLGYIDKLVLFPKVLKEALGWPDLVHICDHSNAFYVKSLQGRPHVVTCHDLLAVRSALGEISEHKTRWSGRKLQGMILDGLKAARNIICVSDATRDELLRLTGHNGADVVRIYNGLNQPFEPMEPGEATKLVQKAGLAPDQPFILHLGGNQWYKNRLGVLKIFARLRKRPAFRNLVLVMAGKPWTEEMREFVRFHELEWCVVELVDVSEETLRALYSRAEVFLFPSLEEGFGWPIAEAQACGCPVVTSNRVPMTEVGGTAATYVDPLDEEAAATAVAELTGETATARLAMHDASLHNAARFSASGMIENYLKFYSGLLKRGAPDGHTGNREASELQINGRATNVLGDNRRTVNQRPASRAAASG